MRQKRSASIATLALSLPMLLALPGGALDSQAADAAPPPGFLTGPNDGDPDRIATDYVQQEAESLGVRTADVSELAVASSYESSHSGVTHVNLNQQYAGQQVFGGSVTVNIAADGSVIHVGEALVEDLREADAGFSIASDVGPLEAVEAAADALELAQPEDLEILPSTMSDPGTVVVSEGGISEEPITTRRGWQPTEDGLRQAWQVVIDDVSDVHLWNATIDAQTGELLDVEDWTISHSHEDLEHLATGRTLPEASGAHRSPDPVEDGSSYRVFDVPKESPNDGDRGLVHNPADGLASPHGWHDVSGSDAPDHTHTQGNNVHAYSDRDANGVPDTGSDPDGGPGLNFDFPMDLTEHSQTYMDAAVANLFYFNNIIHDVLYRYGFDEPSGNFQVNNYGRGGVGGDDVRAEAADGGGHNNANFSTPAQDGGRPRMQMYLWPGPGMPNEVIVEGGSAAGTYGANYARFSPAATNAGLSGAVVAVDDGSTEGEGGTATDGCQPFSVPAGAIALIDQPHSSGSWWNPTLACNNAVPVANAEAAGASAVIFVSNSDGSAPTLTGSMADPVGIPAVTVSQADGEAIRAGLPASATVQRDQSRAPIRDGDLENGIIIHEYGHGVSNRLTGGPTTNCLSGHEQMGEGWSDYLAISMLLDPELDDPEGRRGMGPYALFQDSREGAGIRVTPYSRNMEINPFTYDNIQSNGWRGGSIATPHGVGWGWSSILWDLTWDLMDRHGFNDNVYEAWNAGGNNRAIQYVMDGMKMQGCYPGFLDGRDGIIAAADALADATDTESDSCLLWSSFARRGLGYSAEQGSTNRNDNTEAFDVPEWCAAPGAGFVGPQFANAPALNTREAGETAPIFFNVAGYAGNGSLDILKSNHSPSSQRIDCDTLEPFGGQDEPLDNITTPSDAPGSSGLSYARGQDRYRWNWATDADWAGTCRQLIITLEDGTQHRANFRLTE